MPFKQSLSDKEDDSESDEPSSEEESDDEDSEEEEEESKHLDSFEQQSSELEKKLMTKHNLMLNGTCLPNRLEEIERRADLSWWNPTDRNLWFCLSRRASPGQPAYRPGEMVSFSYGRRSNAFWLTFYGFCTANNPHDSIRLHLTKVLKRDQKQTISSILAALVLSNGALEKRHKFLNENAGTKIAEFLRDQVVEVKLKRGSLSADLLFYIRVNCALFYRGEDINHTNTGAAAHYKPTDLEFEFIALQVYKQALAFIERGNPGRFNDEPTPDPVPDFSSQASAREYFARLYRSEQTKLLRA